VGSRQGQCSGACWLRRTAPLARDINSDAKDRASNGIGRMGPRTEFLRHCHRHYGSLGPGGPSAIRPSPVEASCGSRKAMADYRAPAWRSKDADRRTAFWTALISQKGRESGMQTWTARVVMSAGRMRLLRGPVVRRPPRCPSHRNTPAAEQSQHSPGDQSPEHCSYRIEIDTCGDGLSVMAVTS